MNSATTHAWGERDRRTPEQMIDEVIHMKKRAKIGATAGLAAVAVGVLALGYYAVTGVVDPGGQGAASAAEQEGIPRIER